MTLFSDHDGQKAGLTGSDCSYTVPLMILLISTNLIPSLESIMMFVQHTGLAVIN